MGSVVLRGCVLRALFLGLRTPPFRCCPLFLVLLLLLPPLPPLPPPLPPLPLPPLVGWCVIVWVVLCTSTLHLAGIGWWWIRAPALFLRLSTIWILGPWVFTPHAIEDCKRLNITPVVVVGSMGDAQPYPAAGMRTLYRGGGFDVLASEPKRQVVCIEPAGTLASTDHQGVRRISGGSPTGSMPASTTELLSRARKAGCAVSLSGSGHYKIWGSGVVGEGVSVVVPATGSDGRGLRNAVMQVRSSLGVDVRLV